MAESHAPPVWARGMVSALQRGDHRYVVATGPMALDAAKDDPPLLARVHTWLAQSHARLGDLDAARDHIRLAIREVKAIGDEEGLRQVRELRRQVLAQAKGQPDAPAAPPTLPPPPADTPLGRALAALRLGEPVEAMRLAVAAREAAALAGDPKAEVIALLTMARIPGHAEAALFTARDRADHSGDMNLVAAVARAARELGVDLGSHVF